MPAPTGAASSCARGSPTAGTRCSAATTASADAAIRERFESGESELDGDAGRRGVRARHGAAGARAHHRRHPHRPDPGAARQDRRLRGDGDRPAHGLRRRGALPRHPPRHRMAAGHHPEDRPRPLHGRGGAGPRRPHRRRGAQARHALGVLLRRRARLQAQPRQAHAAPEGGRLRRRGDQAHPLADRHQHRRPEPAGDRHLHHGRAGARLARPQGVQAGRRAARLEPQRPRGAEFAIDCCSRGGEDDARSLHL